MSVDTQRLNQQSDQFTDQDELWLFGYGSLIYKAGFDYSQKRPATISGWTRRFWQGSHDHRGTPEQPGRVATLVESPGETCFGVAYRITPDHFSYLDHREKNGYLRFAQKMTFCDTGETDTGLVYIATANNSAWLGQASIDSMARQIIAASGPSGLNQDYVLYLDEALRAYQADDPHVSALAQRIRELLANADA